MKRTLILGLIGCTSMHVHAQSIEQTFPLKWTADIGNVSYRTQPALVGNRLFVGSNGLHFRDYYHETGNGVYVLDARTGNQIDVIGDDAWGDLDVNGVLAYQGKVFFGNDNDEFMCYNASTLEPEWQLPTSGDCEHAPVLIQRKSGTVVVFATEQGEVRAVQPSTGNTVWVHYHKDFDGWKPGQNRFMYRVAAAVSNGTTYFAAPAVRDLDGDGVDDLSYSTHNGVVGISGQTGEVLFDVDINSGWIDYHHSPLILDHSEGPVLLIVEHRYNNERMASDSYIRRVLLPSGDQLPTQFEFGYVNTPHSLQAGNTHQVMCRNDEKLAKIQSVEPVYQIVDPNDKSHTPYYSTFCSEETLIWKGRTAILEILEYDWKEEKGSLRILDASTWELLDSFTLPDQTESVPHLIDVDGDGQRELLFGCGNGQLYCHEIPQP